MKWATAAFAGLLLLSGCKKDIQNEGAVRAGILKYLTTRPGLADMDVSVRSISFRRNEADAAVHFQAKGNNSLAAGLDMKYVLTQQGGQWVVKSRSGSGMNHGAGMPEAGVGTTPALPPGHPPIRSSPGSPK